MTWPQAMGLIVLEGLVIAAHGSILGWPLLIFVVGLFAVAILYAMRVKGAMLISIIGATIVAVLIELATGVGAKTADNPTGWALNVPQTDRFVALPDLSLITYLVS